MKAVAYSVEPFEKAYLAKANQKKHDITLIANALSLDTANYAEGKEAIIVSKNDNVSAKTIEKLAEIGIKYITTRSTDTTHIDTESAKKYGLKLSNVPDYSTLEKHLQDNANQTIKNLDLWQLNKCVAKACISTDKCDVNPVVKRVKS